jgi:hypothetical protein
VWVENTLVKSGKFSLPGKKALYGDESEIEVVLVDVMESQVERPKKPEKILQWQKETPYAKNAVNC